MKLLKTNYLNKINNKKLYNFFLIKKNCIISFSYLKNFY